ncbi:MAG: hypothetical protein WCY36_07330 [Candidatus Omnitrophota bacterium]
MNKAMQKIVINPGVMTLMPCAPDVCQECAVKHEVWQAHNYQSIYFQYKFHAEHNRWPTWRDAIAHCPEDVQKQWREKLIAMGAWPKDEVKAGAK